MRLFVAVELTEQARQEVAALQVELRQTGADVKWVEPENLHLTLKFFGEVDKARLLELIETLKKCAVCPAFSFELQGVGAFPALERPRVIWLGMNEGKEPMERLAGSLEKECALLGFPMGDRPFSAHLTLGRVRSEKRLPQLAQKLETTAFKTSEPIRVDRLVLFQSVLSSTGPAYTSTAILPLS
ncbi:MAG: RNA 2',3'-cyclic phosphodiesterase [Candidatus Omnitrophica bacterium]|nr:RNA 2',3'-cyclic phosphodiesterase [Candidatus Omnitrophota bacterium]